MYGENSHKAVSTRISGNGCCSQPSDDNLLGPSNPFGGGHLVDKAMLTTLPLKRIGGKNEFATVCLACDCHNDEHYTYKRELLPIKGRGI